MKKLAITAVCLLVVGLALSRSEKHGDGDYFPSALDPDKWRLSWSDEFNSTTLDNGKWEHCPEWQRGGKELFCFWSPRDAYLDGTGNLILRIRQEGDRFLSGAVRTKDRFAQAYGYFEIRCKVPVIRGGWCAFWMMPATGSPVGNGGVDGAEIDIFESFHADEGKVNHAVHWDGYGKDHQGKGQLLEYYHDLYNGKYHTFGLLWEEKRYTFYIDGEQTWRTSAGGISQVPGYLKISIEVAEWAGDIRREQLPKEMIVDWVRVYEARTMK